MGNIPKAFSAVLSYCFLFTFSALKHLKMPVIGVNVQSDTPPPKIISSQPAYAGQYSSVKIKLCFHKHVTPLTFPLSEVNEFLFAEGR